MIILDTSILRTFSPESSSADLLRAILGANAQVVAVPWMVMEELAAQQAIKHQEKFEAAAQALEALKQVTPWELEPELELGSVELDSIRDHWRQKWGTVVGTIPTSEGALRQAVFREANSLPPCKTAKGTKTGSRDAAIWLTAVEYARQHPDEMVYFVSANVRDFGDGTSYPSPMREDIAGMESRFVHLTSMDDIAARFTEPATTDEALVLAILKSSQAQDQIAEEAAVIMHTQLPFECSVVSDLDGRAVLITQAVDGILADVVFSSVESVQTYRIGDHEWCTAVVEWHLSGIARTPFGSRGVGCGWTTAVLFTPDPDEARLTVIRSGRPRPLDEEEFNALELPPVTTKVEDTLQDMLRLSFPQARDEDSSWLRNPRVYDLVQRVRRVRIGDTSVG
ncbi:PIN domain-containing protein [Streptomyces sp. NPDC059850]|uniref:PIN domain-containing protein n=1 Tax=Streptomyces sp. NPDC059850 TaxID=3346970 RepID=UPI00365614B1